MKYSYTEPELRNAIASSYSYRQALLKLNLKGSGGNYKSLKGNIIFLGLNTTHFKGHGWNKGNVIGPKKQLSEYLTINNTFNISSVHLKDRLIKEGYLRRVCNSCSLTEWLQGLIPLELDHIDGNHSNNELSNLRLLCPNCHALTPTYRGKNMYK